MIIGLLTIKLHIPDSNSLKAKRRAIKSLKERMRNRFNISVAEVGNHDKWQLATIAIAALTTDKVHADSSLSSILNFVDSFKNVSIIDYSTELL